MLYTRDAPVRAKLETFVYEAVRVLQFETTLLARSSVLTNCFRRSIATTHNVQL